MARLIRTEKEVEGRYEEVWIVVDEDALDQWPAGASHDRRSKRSTRGRHRCKARGNALFTADIQLPGMLHAAVLRSPYARARVTSIDLELARKAPGVRAVVGPPDLDALTDEPGYVGPRRRRRRRRDLRAGAGGPRADRGAVGSARAAARSRRSGAAGVVRLRRRAATSAATSNVGSPRPTWSSRRSTERRSWCTTRWRRIRPSATGRTTGSRSTSRRSTSGASARDGGPTRPRARQGARHLPRDGRRLRVEEQPRRLHADRGRAREENGAAGQVRVDPARGERRSRQPQRDDPAADRRRRSPTGRSSRSAATSSTPSASPAGPPRPRAR